MFHRNQLSVVLLLASLASGHASAGALPSDDLALHAPCALGIGEFAAVWRAPAAPIQAPDDHAPSRADEERIEQLLRDLPDSGSSSSPETGAISTILLGLALLWAAGPLGRLVSGLETPRRPRRADDLDPQH
jgi:hypothetical protein